MDWLKQKIEELEKEIFALKNVNSDFEARILALEKSGLEAKMKSTVPMPHIGQLNCWEFKKCGREPGGIKEEELGVCPAAELDKYEGINGGRKGGRVCWALVGTLCGGRVQGIFAKKTGTCKDCDFYKYVCKQEGKDFRYALT